MVAGLVWIAGKAGDTGPLHGEEIPSIGDDHIPPGQEHIPYNSNPPTSGPHYAQAQPAGIYDKELADEAVVHSLEHGGVWITYKPDLSKDQIDLLTQIVKKNRSKVLLSPRTKNDSPIALASWTRLLKLDKVDEQSIKEFISANRDHAPETLPL